VAKVLFESGSARSDVLLVGAMSNIETLENLDRDLIAKLLSVHPSEVPLAVFTTKRCLKSSCGFDGTVFNSGDTAIVSLDGIETVVQLQRFLLVRISSEMYTLLGSGVCHVPEIGDNGQVSVHYWSGFSKVKKQSSHNCTFFRIESISRKVMLYPCKENHLMTVVDYKRPFSVMKSDFIVPVYPEIGDMVLVQGESLQDIWHGHVHRVDYRRHTVEVFFFVKRCQSVNRYVREVQGRGALNTVSWDSIIGIAQGEWKSSSTWIKALH